MSDEQAESPTVVEVVAETLEAKVERLERELKAVRSLAYTLAGHTLPKD